MAAVDFSIDYDIIEPVDGTAMVNLVYTAVPTTLGTGIATITGRLQAPGNVDGPGAEAYIEQDLRSRLGVTNPTQHPNATFGLTLEVDV